MKLTTFGTIIFLSLSSLFRCLGVLLVSAMHLLDFDSDFEAESLSNSKLDRTEFLLSKLNGELLKSGFTTANKIVANMLQQSNRSSARALLAEVSAALRLNCLKLNIAIEDFHKYRSRTLISLQKD